MGRCVSALVSSFYSSRASVPQRCQMSSRITYRRRIRYPKLVGSRLEPPPPLLCVGGHEPFSINRLTSYARTDSPLPPYQNPSSLTRVSAVSRRRCGSLSLPLLCYTATSPSFLRTIDPCTRTPCWVYSSTSSGDKSSWCLSRGLPFRLTELRRHQLRMLPLSCRRFFTGEYCRWVVKFQGSLARREL